MEVEEARRLAESLLAEALPRRWAHTQGVAAKARSLVPILGREARLVESAAWLHDIGYSPRLVRTRFHPLDGARYLREQGSADGQTLALVAHHSCAVVEARERACLADLVGEFPLPEGRLQDLLDALTYCDMTTDPGGMETSVRERLAEILTRYPAEDPVHRAIGAASPTITEIAERVEAQLAGAARGELNT